MSATTTAAVPATHRSYPSPGILNRSPAHLLLAAYDFAGSRAAPDCAATLNKLREIVKRELRSDLDDLTSTTPKDVPSAETGELGVVDGYDRAHLTITLGISKSGFDALGIAAADQPQDLIPMPWEQLGDSPLVTPNGDLVLQICSDSAFINEHVTRRIDEELGDGLTLAWAVNGDQRYTTRAGRTAREEGRALIGFLDGTDNLQPRHDTADRRLVFVNPDDLSDYPAIPASGANGPYGPAGPVFPTDLRPGPTNEPAWTRDGTYMVARASVNDLHRWDDVPLAAQEQTIGRFKFSGAALDLADVADQLHVEPNFAEHQEDLRVALTAHIRKANPRRLPEDLLRRIYRRGYPLIVAHPTLGIGGGLVFVCFARTISTQFEFITRGWTNNPDFPAPGTGIDALRQFDSVVLAGGYFFVPAIRHTNQPWSWILPVD
jgi:deferrochelatase/peroxidase EfeB